jgi:3-oxoadipate enol-lactonase
MSLYHRFDGPDDAPVVVLSNSLGTSLEMWDDQIEALTQGFRVLRYDQLGHGRSPVPPGPYTVDRLGGELLVLLDELGLERVSFCGLSLGGMVGMSVASSAPERFDRVVLCCTSAYVGPPETWDERAAIARSKGCAALADAVMERWFTPRFRQEQPETVARIREMVAATPAEGYAACCEALRDWDFRERLGTVWTPTLVIVGEHDPATPPERGAELAAGIPGAGLEVIADAAHLANVEQPEAFSRAVLAHLEA